MNAKPPSVPIVNLGVFTDGDGDVHVDAADNTLHYRVNGTDFIPSGSGGSSAVSSVEGKTGAVHLALSDLSLSAAADVPLNGHKVTGLGTPTTGTDAATKAYADSVGSAVSSVSGKTGAVTLGLQDLTIPPSGNYSMNSHKLTSVTDPTSAQDAATKAYVDAATGTGPILPQKLNDTRVTMPVSPIPLYTTVQMLTNTPLTLTSDGSTPVMFTAQFGFNNTGSTAAFVAGFIAETDNSANFTSYKFSSAPVTLNAGNVDVQYGQINITGVLIPSAGVHHYGIGLNKTQPGGFVTATGNAGFISDDTFFHALFWK